MQVPMRLAEVGQVFQAAGCADVEMSWPCEE
jgi:hypothetical protein